MRNNFKAITAALVFGLATSTVASAMSHLASISIAPLWPTNSNPGNTVLYQVTVERSGQGLLEVNFSSAGLPDGCVASFASNPVRFTGKDPRFVQFLMTITGPAPTPTDSFAFTVTGTARREAITLTNTLPQGLGAAPVAPVLVDLNLRPDGVAELRGLGATGQTYEIEATSDLGNPTWSSVGASTADGNGRFTFIHESAQAKTTPMRFYRAVLLAPDVP
jgi:hypothetical protein